MLRNLLFAVVTALCPALALAEQACRTPDWLVRVYHLGLAVEHANDAPRQEAKSRALLQALGEIPPPELRQRLIAAGLADHAAEIQTFLQAERMAATFRLENPTGTPLPAMLADRLQSSARKMDRILEGLRCDEDPGWRAASAAARLSSAASEDEGPAGPTPSASPAARPRSPEPLEGWTYTLPPLWLIATVLLSLPLGHSGIRLFNAWKATRRRRWRRFYCNIDCTALISDAGSTRAAPVTIVDISQMGAKVHLCSSPLIFSVFDRDFFSRTFTAFGGAGGRF